MDAFVLGNLIEKALLVWFIIWVLVLVGYLISGKSEEIGCLILILLVIFGIGGGVAIDLYGDYSNIVLCKDVGKVVKANCAVRLGNKGHRWNDCRMELSTGKRMDLSLLVMEGDFLENCKNSYTTPGSWVRIKK